MKRILVFGLIAALCLALCGCSFSVASTYEKAEQYQTGDFEYDAAQVDEVIVNWASGQVFLSEGAGRLQAREESKDLTGDQRMRWLLDGRTLRIQFCKSGYRGVIRPAKVLSLQVPKGVRLQVNVTSGSMDLGDMSARAFELNATSGAIRTGALRAEEDLKAEATSGSVRLENAQAQNVTVHTTSGSLTAGPLDVKKDCRISATSGAVSLEAVKADELRVGGTSGAVSVGLYHCNQVKVDTTSGSVRLALLGETGADVRFDTASGSYNGRQAKEGIRETIGDGACKVKVDTTSGSLTVVK